MESKFNLKGNYLLPLFLIIGNSCLAQTYISIAPCITNTPGTFSEKTNIALEVGRQWDVFSMGLDLGKTSFGPMNGKDTSVYLELRPNLNIFQQGKFTNTFTAGIGYIFNSTQNLMTELTSGIEYNYTDKIHFNIYFGQYFYSGKTDASNATFFGISAMFYLSSSNSKPLITNPKK
jgi:hypothetical protein